MSNLSTEVRAVQNPALGAILLWRFCVGYSNNETENSTPIPLAFVVLPLVMHEDTMDFLKSTRTTSGLRAFAGKFSASSDPKQDLLLSLHPRILSMRELTLESLYLATASKLIMIDTSGHFDYVTQVATYKYGMKRSPAR